MKYNSAQIVYASASGNTRFVAQEVYQNLKKILDTQLNRADDPKLSLNFDPNVLYIFATSTWEHGVINPYFEPILVQIKEIKLENIDAAFIGTGDMRYEPVLFCGGMEQLRTTYKDSGGNEIVSPMRIDGEPRQYKDTIIKKWNDKLIAQIERDG